MNDTVSASSWQMLGELILSVGSNPDELISLWLKEQLAPLGLHEKFLTRVLQSAQNYAGRALRADMEAQFGHIHLSLFGPNERTSKGQTWGFFRIEKIDSGDQNLSHPDHTLEFYLSREQG